MSIHDLRPGNSKKAPESSVNAFRRFLTEERVSVADIMTAVRSEPTGAILIALMDRFGYHLAHMKSRDGKPLRRNTVGQYFRQTELWLFERFPQFAQLVDGAILAQGRIVVNFSGMRPGGKTTKQAPACTKQDLYSLLGYMYATATGAVDYQDAALLALLWYLFGRASDLVMVEKQSLSICGANMLFVRFLRMKTSEEQGLTLFPDNDTITCPLTAIAFALVLQSTPKVSLLPHLPQPAATDFGLHRPQIPLSAVLASATLGRSLLQEETTSEEAVDGTTSSTKTSSVPLGIHAYVNRVLGRVFAAAKVSTALSSHAFRRGGAQHVNGKPGVSPHWIADRGGWNMSATNKVFTYIFNTTEEDQKIAKLLSGHDADAPLLVLDISHFDATTKEKIKALQNDLFASCRGMQNNALNVSDPVIGVLFAYFLKALPQHRSMNPTSPLVSRVEQAMMRVGVRLEELLAWSLHLGTVNTQAVVATQTQDTKYIEIIKQQAAVIDLLIDNSAVQGDRMRVLERKLGVVAAVEEAPVSPRKRKHEEETPAMPRKQKALTYLHETWYEWLVSAAYLTEPDRKWTSTMPRCVAYMLLFADTLCLERGAPDFCETALDTEKAVDAKVQGFLRAHAMDASSTGSVEKKLRLLHKQGELNERILAHDARVRAGLVVDPTPKAQQAAPLRTIQPLPPLYELSRSQT